MFICAPLLEFRHHHQFSLHHLQLWLQHKDCVSLENMLALVRNVCCWELSVAVSAVRHCNYCSGASWKLWIWESQEIGKVRHREGGMSSQGDRLVWIWAACCMLALSPQWSDHDQSPRPALGSGYSQGCWGWKSQGQGQLQAATAAGITSCHLHSVPDLLNTDTENGMGLRSKGVNRCKDW